ncbi:MAG: prepilin peptidase [Thermodesulfovibrionales bacterium]|nr:prepilin peptidase [Thermodesulfovibrionales bacterium]
MLDSLDLLIFVLGLIAGSFMNVCIYRIPRNLSLIKPGSRCPDCKSPVKPYDNIPVLSFFLLRGKCRTCGAKIHWRYPVVEFLNGILWLIIFNKFGDTPYSLPFLFFASCLVVITFIDIEHMIIPDIITVPGTLIGIALGPILPDPFFRLVTLGFLTSLTGALTGFLLFFIIAVIGEWIFKREAMGGGDIKLMAMVGAFTGWKGVILTTFSGSLIGALAGVVVILSRKRSDTVIPFGPYLAGGAMVSLLFGQEVMNLWLRWIQG